MRENVHINFVKYTFSEISLIINIGYSKTIGIPCPIEYPSFFTKLHVKLSQKKCNLHLFIVMHPGVHRIWLFLLLFVL